MHRIKEYLSKSGSEFHCQADVFSLDVVHACTPREVGLPSRQAGRVSETRTEKFGYRRGLRAKLSVGHGEIIAVYITTGHEKGIQLNTTFSL